MSKKLKFTLADLAPVSAELKLKHPITDEELGVSLTVIGTETVEFKAAFKSIQKKRATLSKEEATDVEGVEAAANELLAACVIGWSSDEFFDGEFTKEKMLGILENPGFEWLTRQLNKFIDDRSNFFRKGN